MIVMTKLSSYFLKFAGHMGHSCKIGNAPNLTGKKDKINVKGVLNT